MADPVFAHVTVLFQILQFQGPFQMIVYIVFQLPQIGGTFFLPVLRGMRDACSGEKFCQNGGYEACVPQLVR